MKLLLIRHGVAEERGPRYPDDSLRPLTEAGMAKMATIAAGLETLARPLRVLSSPFTRARQTADIVAKQFSAEVEEIQALCVGNDDQLFEAAAWGGEAVVAAVGHEPLLSMTLSNLLTGNESTAQLLFKKGAAALVECGIAPRPGTGRLEWLIQPGALRALARTNH